MPLSWRHYLYGLRFIGRNLLRAQMANAQAFRIAQGTPDEYTAWQLDAERMVKPAGGLNDGRR